jgi:hypothetical protein
MRKASEDHLPRIMIWAVSIRKSAMAAPDRKDCVPILVASKPKVTLLPVPILVASKPKVTLLPVKVQ